MIPEKDAPDAVLIISSSESDSNLYWATGFLAPDPFVFILFSPGASASRKVLLMSDLEVDRARAQARVDEVRSYSAYESRLAAGAPRRFLDVVVSVLAEEGAKRLLVPWNFPVEYADGLRERGFDLVVREDPFFEGRAIKSKEEVEAIQKTQRDTEEAVAAAVEAIARSDIRRGELFLDGEPLTSERIKQIINLKLMEKGSVAQHTIVACGDDACDPHNEGSGVLKANHPIVMDVFPRNAHSRYFADMTRTVVRGKATPQMKRLYQTVLGGQEIGFRMIRDGAHGAEIHRKIEELFEERGYRTGLVEGRMQGFFHGTGHGVGLDIHEPPRISKRDWVLKAGEVVTVEPGLYYPGIGAVRIEDMVLVNEKGCENLTNFPKVLEL